MLSYTRASYHVPQLQIVDSSTVTAMGSHRPTSQQRTSHALTRVLRSKGFAVGDFELEEDTVPALSDLFGAMGGMLRVRCASTGEERMYSIGSGSAWLGAFLMDLGSGHFARAAREHGIPLGAAGALGA
jgi:hypothetical protein